jgi:predicted DNA-binding WGR domain protein/8-oxo-dGTP pyrophosphatase MutT (NUDIX family)
MATGASGGSGGSSKGSFLANLFGSTAGAGAHVLADPHYGNSQAPPAYTKSYTGSEKHPAKDDHGRDVFIHRPRSGTPAHDAAWGSKDGVVTITPGQAVPASLNGISMKPWNAPANYDWTKVPGQNPAIERGLPELGGHKWKYAAAGVIIQEPDGRLWITSPTNGFGGYRHTYPKGTQEKGLDLQQTAIKEAWEETGLRVQITGVLGDFERTNSVSRFYFAKRIGGSPSRQGWESQALRLVPQHALKSFLNMPVDRDIADALKEEHRLTKGRRFISDSLIEALAKSMLVKFEKKGGAAAPKAGGGKAGAWQTQPRWQGGTPLGGQWKTYDSAGLTKPPTIGSSANPANQNKVNAAYGFVKAGDTPQAELLLTNLYGSLQAKGLINPDGTYAKAGNSQQKWTQQAHQYVADLVKTNGAMPQVQAKAEVAAGIPSLASYKKIGAKPGGSNPGAIYSDGKGNPVLVKGANHPSDDRAKNEVLASKLMQAAGVGAPDMHLVDLQGQYGGGLGVAAKMEQLEGWKNSGADKAAAQSEFAVHAWLANYDAVGQPVGDNLAMKGGKVFNYDPGGALLYRAQGLKKDFPGGVLPSVAKEWETMRSSSVNAAAASVYGSMTKAQLQLSAQKVAAVTDDTIKALVAAHGPGDQKAKDALTSALIARKADILAKAGIGANGVSLVTPPAPEAMLTGHLNKPAAAQPAGFGGVDPATGGKSVGAASEAALAGNKTAYEAHLTHTEGHNKFYTVTVTQAGDGSWRVDAAWGKIGTAGQTMGKGNFKFASDAVSAAKDLVGSKQAKGYNLEHAAEHTSVILGVAPKPAAAAAPAPTATPPYPFIGQLKASLGVKAMAAHEAIQTLTGASHKTGLSIKLANMVDAIHESHADKLASLIHSLPTGVLAGSNMAVAVKAVEAFGIAGMGHLTNAAPPPAATAAKPKESMTPLALASIGPAPKGLKWNGKQAAQTQIAAAGEIGHAKAAMQKGDLGALKAAHTMVEGLKNNHQAGSLAISNLAQIQGWMETHAAKAGASINGHTTEQSPAERIAAAHGVPTTAAFHAKHGVSEGSFLANVSTQALGAIKSGDDKQLATMLGHLGMQVAAGSHVAEAMHDEITALASSSSNSFPLALGTGATVVHEAPTASAHADLAAPPPMPNFQGGTAGFYQGVVNKMDAAYAAGDMAALQASAHISGGPQPVWPTYAKGPNVGQPKTMNGTLAQQHYTTLVQALEGKHEASVAATISNPDFLAKVANPPAPGAQKGDGPAMPHFDAAKIPGDNSNAGSHNKKVDQIASLAADGDVKGLLSLGYGSNTYGKKQAALANSALAAMGSSLQVDAGQKANTHLALTGGVPADQAAAAMVNTGHTPLKAPKLGKIVPKLTPKDMPFQQNFIGGADGKGLSSDPAKNQANQELLNKMVELAKAGDLHGLQNLTFVPLGGGKAVGVSQHPSKHITSFRDGALAAMDEIMHPPTPLQVFEAKTAAKGAAAVAAQFPPKPLGTNVHKVKSNEKAGYYMALGKVSGHEKLVPAKEQNVTPAHVQQAFTDYKQMPKIVKDFMYGAQHNASTLFGEYRKGTLNKYQGHDTVEMSKQAHAWARTKPAGTKIYGWKNMSADQVHQIEKAGPGLVIQDPGPNCMSYSKSATTGFGTHLIEAVYADGAKAVDSHGSGAYGNEKEITTLPGTRFIVLSVTPLEGAKAHSGGKHIKLLMLPPDPSMDPYKSAWPKG